MIKIKCVYFKNAFFVNHAFNYELQNVLMDKREKNNYKSSKIICPNNSSKVINPISHLKEIKNLVFGK